MQQHAKPVAIAVTVTVILMLLSQLWGFHNSPSAEDMADVLRHGTTVTTTIEEATMD